MTPWTDKEINRFLLRVPMLQRRGMTFDEAEQFADRLAIRDQERDDRRACIECVSMQQDGGCLRQKTGYIKDTSKHFTVMKTVFQRCDFFEFLKPNKAAP